MADRRRLFFALWPDDATRLRIDQWRKHCGVRSGLPTSPANLHITLCFLGSVEAAMQPAIEQAVAPVSSLPALGLSLDQCGYWLKPRVLWLGCQQPPVAVVELAEALRQAMQGIGLSPDARPYVPHLSVQRKLSAPARLPAVPEPITWSARDFVLAWSRSSEHGVEYRVLRRWPLASDAGGD